MWIVKKSLLSSYHMNNVWILAYSGAAAMHMCMHDCMENVHGVEDEMYTTIA